MPRDYKQEYKTQKKRGEHDGRMERQRARREFDRKDTGSVNRKSPKRAGMDLSHKKAIHKGGKNSDGVSLEKPSTNRARNGHSKSHDHDHTHKHTHGKRKPHTHSHTHGHKKGKKKG